MVGDALFGGHPTSIQVFVNKIWKINMTPSNDMPDLEDLPFGNIICFISCCLAVFFLEWFLFSGNENLTIVNWCDFKMFLHSPIQFNVQVCCVMRDGSGIHFLGPNKMPLATRQMLFQWFGLKETSACFGVAKKDQPTAKGCTVYADLTNLRHWKLTWNLKIICLKSKSQLPSTIFWVPRYRLGVGTPTKNTPDFGRSKKPSTKRPKEKDLIQKDQFFATDLAPLGSCAFWYHKVEFYITKDGVFINIVKG